MACDEGLTERRMFGGIAFMLNGHMTQSIVGETLMAQVWPGEANLAVYAELLS